MDRLLGLAVEVQKIHDEGFLPFGELHRFAKNHQFSQKDQTRTSHLTRVRQQVNGTWGGAILPWGASTGMDEPDQNEKRDYPGLEVE